MRRSVYEIACYYVDKGISILPIGTNKRPDFHVLPQEWDENEQKEKGVWYHYQSRLPTREELKKWYFRSNPSGIGGIGGAVSGGLLCIDLDNMDVAEKYIKELTNHNLELFNKLIGVKSPRGMHFWLRNEMVEGSEKLASPSAKKCKEEGIEFKAFIETRGEKGYALLPGSPARCHPENMEYSYLVPDRDIGMVQTITCQEKDYLLDLARSFDLSDKKAAKAPTQTNYQPPSSGMSPIEHFDRFGPSFEELLYGTGAEFIKGGGDDGQVRRPGKDDPGGSATVGGKNKGEHGEPLMHVFTSNWPPFEENGNYGKYNTLRLLRFKEDGKAAFKYIVEKGFGDKKYTRPTSSNGSLNGHVQGQSEVVEEWNEEPIPLQDMEIELPEFPLDVFPKDLQSLLKEIGASVNCAVDYSATYALGIAAGTVGARFALELKSGYTANSNLWICSVARKGSGKTPSIEPISKPVYDEQALRYKNGDKKPAYIRDITVEKLADLLNMCPEGLLMIQDEASGWIKSLNQYKKAGGNDRQIYLSLWSSEPIHIHRKDPLSIPLFVNHPRLSIIGGIQPDRLDQLRQEVDDGFYDRFLFCFPKESPLMPEQWNVIDQTGIDKWGKALANIRNVAMRTSQLGNLCPTFLFLDDSGKDSWNRWTKWVVDQVNQLDFPEFLRGPLVKIQGCVARIAMVLHILNQAYGGPPGFAVNGDTMDKAASLGKYFFAHAERVYSWAGLDERTKPATVISNWLSKQTNPYFRRSDLWRNIRHNKIFNRPEDLIEPIKLLLAHRYIRYYDEEIAQGPGRKSAPVYEINNKILGKYH